NVRLLAKLLDSPIYPLHEHLLQLGLTLVVATLDSERGKKHLMNHLTRDHLLQPKLNKANKYDVIILKVIHDMYERLMTSSKARKR
ncbi:hypothetical protein ACFLVL_03765, partial [Chloroflexota bacterium]